MTLELTDKHFWDINWDKTAFRGVLKEYSPYRFCRFHFLLKQFLPPSDGHGRLLEVGCVPGRHLVYFNREFGYKVDGVDFSEHIELVHEVMQYHGIADYGLVKQDFLEYESDPYDVVASFGFLEHFFNWREMLGKHIQLIAPAGYLVVSVPNLKYGQYWLHRLLDPEFENEQVVDATNLNKLKTVVSAAGFEILYAGYYQTFHFFSHHRTGKKALWRRAVIALCLAAGAFFTRLRINIPNRWFSPQVICIARNGKTKDN